MVTLSAAIRMHEILKHAEAEILSQTGLSVNLAIKGIDVALNLPTILTIVCDALGVDLTKVVSPCRKQPLAEARFITMYLCRLNCKDSIKYIGKQLGDRDHTTVIRGLRMVKHMIDTRDEQFLLKLTTAIQALEKYKDENKINTHAIGMPVQADELDTGHV